MSADTAFSWCETWCYQHQLIAHAAQEVGEVANANHENAKDILINYLKKRVSSLVTQPRGQLVQEAVPELTNRIFVSIRAGFVGDTVRKFNFHVLLQLQDGLTEYLQRCMDQENVGALCDAEEVKLL